LLLAICSPAFAEPEAVHFSNAPVTIDGKALERSWKDAEWRHPAKPHTVLWEVAIKVFDDSFSPGKSSQPVTLTADKTMGFMLAYCDNDGSKDREHFVGSHHIEPVNGDKNSGYIDASVFGSITLEPSTP